ncbi:MAG: hypothetical protein KC619_04505 [Myxococcales bacterium]|nr:hypothetical protein [Myxococcales bacterium]
MSTSTPNQFKSSSERRLRREVERARRSARLSIGIALAATVLVPVVATALGPVPHTFATGDAIVAAEMNENFEHLRAAIDGLEGRVARPIAYGTLVGSPMADITVRSSTVVVPGLAVDITTSGGPVSVTLIPGPASNGSGFVRAAGTDCGVGNRNLHLRLERRSSLDFEVVNSQFFGAAFSQTSGGGGNVSFPPSAFRYIDTTAPAGTHTYRMAVQGNYTCDHLHLQNLRMAAWEGP